MTLASRTHFLPFLVCSIETYVGVSRGLDVIVTTDKVDITTPGVVLVGIRADIEKVAAVNLLVEKL